MRPITTKGGITGTDLPRVTGKVKIETNEQKKREHRKRKVSTRKHRTVRVNKAAD